MAKSKQTICGQFNSVGAGVVRYFPLNTVSGQTNSGHSVNDPSNLSNLDDRTKAYLAGAEGEIKSFSVVLGYPITSGSATFTIMKNGNPTSSVATIVSGKGEALNDTSVDKEDLYSMKVDNQSADAIEGVWAIEITYD